MTRRIAATALAACAVFGIAAVNMIDPTSGAIATPQFQEAVQARQMADAQILKVDSAVAGQNIATASYSASTETPPPAAPAAATDASSTATTPSTKSGSSSTSASSLAFVAPDPGSAKAAGLQAVLAAGWDQSQFACLDKLWTKESGWRINAMNPSGAYGIPQSLPGSRMAAAGADWQTNAATQIAWGLSYIRSVYQTPCGAWAHSVANNWY